MAGVRKSSEGRPQRRPGNGYPHYGLSLRVATPTASADISDRCSLCDAAANFSVRPRETLDWTDQNCEVCLQKSFAFYTPPSS